MMKILLFPKSGTFVLMPFLLWWVTSSNAQPAEEGKFCVIRPIVQKDFFVFKEKKKKVIILKRSTKHAKYC